MPGVSATMVIENVTPATVIIDAAIVESTARAPSAPRGLDPDRCRMASATFRDAGTSVFPAGHPSRCRARSPSLSSV